MRNLFFLLAFVTSISFGQRKAPSDTTINSETSTFANSFFDDGKKAKQTGAGRRVKEVFLSLIDDYTGDPISFSKVVKWLDGTTIDDSKVDGVIYRKKGSEYYKRNFHFLTPEMFGAAGDGKTDDIIAFRKMFAFAKSQNLATIEAGSGKTYKLTSFVELNYLKQGTIDSKLQFNGNGCRIFLAAGPGGNGWWAFNIATDKTPYQNTKFNFNNITFSCDNVNRPSAIKVSGACFVTIESCKFENLGQGVNFEFAGMSRINNCWAWGCVVGFLTYRSRDIYINECHAYGCDWGYKLEGVNNFGSDGNVSVTNSVANACKKFNIKLKGLYTPFINNCVFELAPTNISIESCNYGKMSNVFCGPGTFEIIKDPKMLSNDFWNISNMDCQGLVTINSLKFSNITNFKVSVVSGRDNPESTSIIFSDGYKNNISALTVEGTRPEVKNAIVVYPNCNIFTWSNLLLDRQFILKGKDRGGVHIMAASIINGDVIAEGGAFKKAENFDYLSTADGTKHAVKNGKIVGD